MKNIIQIIFLLSFLSGVGQQYDIQLIDETVSLIEKKEKLQRNELNWEELTNQPRSNDSEFIVWSRNDTIHKVSLASFGAKGNIKFILYCLNEKPIKTIMLEEYNNTDTMSQDSINLIVPFKEEIYFTGAKEYFPGEIEYEVEIKTEGRRLITDMYCQVNELLHPLAIAKKGIKK
ncbi:hypothetical protein ACA086_06050 [Muriicola sp. E247]|uniref:hypothetical protein n=1 Tax=Muriicola sp. E247 TaxID=3242730 RepID=UPI0035247091